MTFPRTKTATILADMEALLLVLDPTLSPSTRRTVYAVTRAVFDTAVRDRLLAANPVAAVRRPRLEHREAGHLEAEQLRALLTAATDDPVAELVAAAGGHGYAPWGGRCGGLTWT